MRGIIWGIGVHSIQRGGTLIFSSVNIEKGYKDRLKSEGRCTKGALRFRENLTINVIVSSNSCHHPLLSYGNNPQ